MFVIRFISYSLTPPPPVEPVDRLGEVANIFLRRPFDSGLSGRSYDFLDKFETDLPSVNSELRCSLDENSD